MVGSYQQRCRRCILQPQSTGQYSELDVKAVLLPINVISRTLIEAVGVFCSHCRLGHCNFFTDFLFSPQRQNRLVAQSRNRLFVIIFIFIFTKFSRYRIFHNSHLTYVFNFFLNYFSNSFKKSFVTVTLGIHDSS